VNVFFDHNLSPAMARALRELFRDRHHVTWLGERFRRTATDLEWIQQLSAEDRWIVISGDRRITRNRAEYGAFQNSRLVGFFLSRGLHKATVIKQFERILAHWDNIETIEGHAGGGAIFELPMTTTRIRQLKL
jgi:hypothetical protein